MIINEFFSHHDEEPHSALDNAAGLVGQAFAHHDHEGNANHTVEGSVQKESEGDLLTTFEALRERIHSAADNAEKSVHEFRTHHANT